MTLRPARSCTSRREPVVAAPSAALESEGGLAGIPRMVSTYALRPTTLRIWSQDSDASPQVAELCVSDRANATRTDPLSLAARDARYRSASSIDEHARLLCRTAARALDRAGSRQHGNSHQLGALACRSLPRRAPRSREATAGGRTRRRLSRALGREALLRKELTYACRYHLTGAREERASRRVPTVQRRRLS